MSSTRTCQEVGQSIVQEIGHRVVQGIAALAVFRVANSPGMGGRLLKLNSRLPLDMTLPER